MKINLTDLDIANTNSFFKDLKGKEDLQIMGGRYNLDLSNYFVEHYSGGSPDYAPGYSGGIDGIADIERYGDDPLKSRL